MGYGKIHAGNIITWAHPKWGNSRVEGRTGLQSSTEPDTSQGSQTTGKPILLSSGIQNIGNDQSEDEIV